VDERTKWLVDLIDRYFDSDIPDDEKHRMAGEMFKKLAQYNRITAEARGIGKESNLSPQMTPDILRSFCDGDYLASESYLLRFGEQKPIDWYIESLMQLESSLCHPRTDE
jgi:hypothetical protein